MTPPTCLLAGLALPAAAAVHPDDPAIHAKLDEILSRSEFNPDQEAGRWSKFLERYWDFIHWLEGLREAAPALYWLIVLGLIVLLVLLLAHMIWTVTRVLGLGHRPAAEETGKEKRRRLSATYREEAARRAAQGDYTEAIRFLFLSLVYRFDESGRVLFLKAYTNREYLRLFADRPPVYRDLKVFVDTLDDHWYGQRPTERARYEDCLALYESLK